MLSLIIKIVNIILGGMKMVDLYVALIVNKRRNINQVPVHLQAEVLADLNALGLDGYGNPLPTEPTE